MLLEEYKVRYPYFCSLIILAFLTFFTTETLAQSQARVALESGLNQVLEIIKSPNYANPATRQKARDQIAVIVKQKFDFMEFSSRTVGPRWQKFSPKEQQDFSAAFADLLINTYVNKIDGYNGEQISYQGERSANNRCENLTLVSMKDGKKIPVAYRMLPKDNTWKVYDVIIENISLVKNYRTQFQDILTSSTPMQLIERIRVKAQEARNNHGKP